MEHADAALGKVEGYQQWRQRVTQTTERHNQVLLDCEKIAQNDPPSVIDRTRILACKTDARRNFVIDMQKLGDELAKLGGDAVAIARQFPGEIIKCLRT